MTPWTRGRRVGVDVGTVRVGVAVCDPDGILASPVATVPRDPDTDSDRTPSDMSEILRLVAEYEAVAIVVGLPINLAGQEGPAAVLIRQYADRLAALADPVPVLLTDERMSTAAATRRLSERGVRGRRQRAVIDQVAAVEILQRWLDTHRAGAVRG
ncbi:Holliday junction resolvase RuvX [Dactylosporangium aurantiacum]|uniref:Putative pre-16S rRNA nuclease n=1 Tax=Dactylosporangium aurantiacum TaxID=35754 RepID=A0A9Q9IPQ0_9ACTN|nr:Holliday junction resolvase RuvX [Dactylosporangium aurantiacum]MDG6102874.1 Holliday junction resolvase RuvX [Dactylosporangium aurantiacum]UWZ60032.1 Holliday junction resolvase RuvX [Dactylosporangium aurantiacum]